VPAARAASFRATTSGTTLTSLYGIGPVSAGRIFAEVGDVTRFAYTDTFAATTALRRPTCPSGGQIWHRRLRAESATSCTCPVVLVAIQSLKD